LSDDDEQGGIATCWCYWTSRCELEPISTYNVMIYRPKG